MNFFFRLYTQPLLVLMAFLLIYVLAYMGISYSIREDTPKNLKTIDMPNKEGVSNAPYEVKNESKTLENSKDLDLIQEPQKEEKEELVQTYENTDISKSSSSKENAPLKNETQEDLQTLGDYIVVPSSVNVRALPSTKGKVIGGLLKDQSVQVLEIKKDWAKIQFSSSKQGYVFLKLLKKATLDDTTPQKEF
ncbi:SH3 domain-containing protein [Helicobacter cetorum]|uniref:SH3b domain-containing protein n=1 Tax=Helicobacter cetorum (strain ATCC BAA-429 / MIT 00-7128) TaxID=182217 RepID=I0ELA2_HELC0|nr:SH3 domain-containing protein [Helicobacter cetorum]AFI03721.1 hypothetical protein HCW_02190 [Helicobacter cetorum MIT 00-7128]